MKPALKRSLIRCGGLLVVLILASVGVVSYFLMGTYRPGEILDFRPAKLTIRAGEPLYFSLKDRLFFDRDGPISAEATPIWKGQVNRAWVSPDSTHILILSGATIHLLTSQGDHRQTFTPAGELFLYPEKGERPYWDASSIQWTPNSQSFFMLRRWTNAVGPVALYRFRLGDDTPRELTAIKHPPRNFLPSDSLALSISGQSVYYAMVEDGTNYALYRFDTETSAVTVLRDITSGPQPPELSPLDPRSIFVNFPLRALGGNGTGLSWARSLDLKSHLLVVRQLKVERCSLLRYTGDQLTPLLRARQGVSAKSGPYCPIYLDESYYLPGNRYALVRVRTAQHDGYLYVDVQEGQYALAQPGLEISFALNSRNSTGVSLAYDGLKLLPGLDEAAVLPRIEAMAH